ncbi:MAG: hypothetical protein K6F03_05745 [Saccharofermentans sp.]|nr:hypothetical protein [Saccharofermentans sp.]
MNKGKKPAQTTDEIIQDLAENKERQISRSRGQALYPKERNEVVEATISKLVGMSFEQMAKLATSEHIALNDITELKKRSLIYLKACQEKSVFPSMAGLARCLGYSRRELELWRSKHQASETAKWLDSFADACAETLHQAALTKSTSEITTIFLSKALYGMTETQNLILTQGASDTHEEIDLEALEAEYRQYVKDTEENNDDL